MKLRRYSRLAGYIAWLILSLLLVSCAADEDALVNAALHDENAGNRQKAVQTLKKLESSSAVDALLKATLSDEDEAVRIKAVEALGVIGSDYAVDALAKVVDQSENTLVRNDLAKYESAYDALSSALSDEDEYARFFAQKALETVNMDSKALDLGTEEIARKALETLMDIRCYAVQALAEAGSEHAAESLVTALTSENSNVGFRARDALLEMKSESVMDELIGLLDDDNLMLPRYHAAQILGEIGNKQAGDALLACLRTDSDEVLNILAAYSMEKIADKIGDEELAFEAHRYILYDIADGSYTGYIRTGNGEDIPLLIEALFAYGDKSMAEAFLNCGNEQLTDAARRWAQIEGYVIEFSSVGNYAAWGGN